MKDVKGEALTDQMRAFVSGMAKQNVQVELRSEPVKKLSRSAVVEMIKEYDFFDSGKHSSGKGIAHRYQLLKINQDKVVIDFTTGLMWQQGGSENSMRYSDAKAFIDQLNENNFADFNDWRLPTLEEVMSLMECEEKNSGFYIDPIFDRQRRWIWTFDKESGSVVWRVYFDYGYCNYDHVYIRYYFVRAVR